MSWDKASSSFCRAEKLPVDFVTRHAYMGQTPEHKGRYRYHPMAPVQVLMEEMRRVVHESIVSCENQRITDWSSIKSKVKSNLSGYLYKNTRRSPMILPVIIEV